MQLSRTDRDNRPRDAVLAAASGIFLLSAGLFLVAWSQPGLGWVAFRWWLVAVTCVLVAAATWTTAGTLRRQQRSAFDRVQSRTIVPPEPPERLINLERLVTVSNWDGRDYRSRLRPLLVDIARQRLATYRGIDLDTEPDVARMALGDPVWTALFDAAPSQQPDPPGIRLDDLRNIIETLEGLDD